MAGKKPGIDPGHPDAVRLVNISKTIRKKPVLRNVDLQVPVGTVMAVCGPNGAGKTTLIRIFMGLLQVDSGVVRILAAPCQRSFLFHSPCLFPDLTLRQNCRFFLTSRGKRFDEEEFAFHVEKFGLKRELGIRVGGYSRGMLQKADLIRALLENPRVMFLDEPTSHLDPLGKVLARKILKSRVAGGMTLVLTSHLLAEVEKLADQVCLIHQGKVLWRGGPGVDPATGADLETRFVGLISGNREPVQ